MTLSKNIYGSNVIKWEEESSKRIESFEQIKNKIVNDMILNIEENISKLNNQVLLFVLFIIALLISGIVFTSATVSKMNIELQKMNSEVEKQEDTNQSLAMKINEMASLENIQTISKNLGLSYNNENIKTIE